MNTILLKKGRQYYFLLSYFVYFFLNQVFLQISLSISERRPVILPGLIGKACDDGVFDYKIVVLFTSFVLLKLGFVLFVCKSKWVRVKYPFLIGVVGVYLVTDLLFVLLSVAFPNILWAAYFYSSFPTLKYCAMMGYPAWIVMLPICVLLLLVFCLLAKRSLKDVYRYFLYVPVSFLIYFGVIYLYLGFVPKV